ncbi:hypothetical protein L195_g064660, partial [Trifolium pratense]
MLGLCKAQQTSRAINLIEGIAYEGLAEEALELFNELCYKGFLKNSSAEK